jgi:hypothetical protein
VSTEAKFPFVHDLPPATAREHATAWTEAGEALKSALADQQLEDISKEIRALGVLCTAMARAYLTMAKAQGRQADQNRGPEGA